MGCAGVLSRSATTAKARQAVQAISSGELWADRKTLSHLVRELLSEANHHLTRREAEIQALLGEGLRNHEIADRLFISPQTVRWHLRSMYSKLGTHDRHSIKSRLLAGLE
jgi:DNA-binding NarL/FixJ family response regulator